VEIFSHGPFLPQLLLSLSNIAASDVDTEYCKLLLIITFQS